MCGIVGVFSPSGNDLDLKAGISALSHRGPDANGAVETTVRGVAARLGHARLSIVDLTEAGAQPMFSRDRRWLVSFNGEIYNHEVIRQDMPDFPWRGRSDTETLVEGIARFGLDAMLPRLNGMFAFAVLDLQEGVFCLVRDPFGIKPLYHAPWGRGIAFASEIRGLSAMGVDTGQLDPSSLGTLLAIRYVPSPHTILAGVSRVPPGTCIRLRSPDLAPEVKTYIHPTQERFQGTFDDAVEAYGACVQAAIQRQTMSDVPVGVLLSGGVDSAMVSCLAKRAGMALETFTVGYGGNNSECEIQRAASFARGLGVPHHSVEVNAKDLLAIFPGVVSQVEEPLGTVSMLPMWYLCKLAKEHVTVVLTGQGSDEPLGGYRRYQGEVIRRQCQRLGLEPLLRWLSRWKSPRTETAGRFLRSMREQDTGTRFLRAYEMFFKEDREALEVTSAPGREAEAIQGWLQWLGDSPADDVDRMMRLDARMDLGDDLLLYGDKVGMAFSLEARVPMLDLELVKLIESFPVRYRVGLGKGKIVHKAFASTLMPKEHVYQKKLGFPLPFHQWSRTDWRKPLEEVLLDTSAPYLSTISSRAVERLWREHLSGIDHSRGIFTLVSLAYWFQGKNRK